MTQTNEINCTFFFSLLFFLFVSWGTWRYKERRLLQVGMLVGQYTLILALYLLKTELQAIACEVCNHLLHHLIEHVHDHVHCIK